MRATGCSLCFGSARDDDAEAAPWRCFGDEAGAVVGARGFGMRACPSRGRCLPRGDGVGNDRELWRVFGTVCGRFCIALYNADACAHSQQVACFALLLLLKNLQRAIPVLLSPLPTQLSAAVRAHRRSGSILALQTLSRTQRLTLTRVIAAIAVAATA